MAYAAGVGRGPDVHPGAGSRGAVAAHDIAVLVPGKVGQLVHADKVEGFALIVVLVLCVVQTAEIDLRPAGEGPAVARAVVPRFGKHRLVVPHGLVDELRKLRVSLSQDERPVVRDVYLPQCLDDEGVALTASGSAPVQSLVLGARHKSGLSRLRRPDHRSSSAPFLLHSVCLPSVARPGASRPAKLFLSRPDFPGLPMALCARVAAPSICCAAACILLAAAPTAPPCFRHWRRSSPLPPLGEVAARSADGEGYSTITSGPFSSRLSAPISTSGGASPSLWLWPGTIAAAFSATAISTVAIAAAFLSLITRSPYRSS